jgi:hypothetical protein
MSQDLSLVAKWEGRFATLEEVVTATSRYVRLLDERAGIGIDQWDGGGSESWITSVVSHGVNRRDSDGSPIVHLGYVCTLRHAGHLDLTLGVGASDPPSGNFLRLGRPPGVESSVVSAALLRPEDWLPVVLATVEVWQPDWLTVASSEVRAAQREPDPWPLGFTVGLLTFISHRLVLAEGPMDEVGERVGTGWLIRLSGNADGSPLEAARVRETLRAARTR